MGMFHYGFVSKNEGSEIIWGYFILLLSPSRIKTQVDLTHLTTKFVYSQIIIARLVYLNILSKDIVAYI